MSTPAVSTRAGEVLAAYSDLDSDIGPIHARIAADLGARLLSGAPFPAYQAITPSLLRALISLDAPTVPYLEDPRQLAPTDRSEPWTFLCDQVNSWHELPGPQRLRVARVLAKLGFWQLVVDLVDPDPDQTTGPEARPLAFLRAVSLFRLDEHDANGLPRMRELAIAKSTDERLPVTARLSAAVNVAVNYARTDRNIGAARYWQSIAKSMAASAELGPLLRSAYWRGLGLIRFLEGDHAEVARTMQWAEDCALQAISEATGSELLVALENMTAVLETRGRAAWTSGDLDAAEHYFRRLVELDPLDSKVHVRLADFLLETNRADEARDQYHLAADLGAPFTVYARARAARLVSR